METILEQEDGEESLDQIISPRIGDNQASVPSQNQIDIS